MKCECCETVTRQIWGFVSRGDADVEEAHAVYFIRWTDGHPENGIALAVSIGGWGGNTPPRVCIGLQCHVDKDGPVYRFVDPDANPFANEAQLGRSLSAREARSPEVEPAVMRVINALQASDNRYAAVLTSWLLHQRN